MFHRPHHDGRSIRAAWLRLAAALAVMLLAVLPHATLAASARHAAPATMSSHHGDAMPAGEPCHERDRPAPASHGAMPSCCILGCGLVASSPAAAERIVTARWATLVPGRSEHGDALAPEPAERPPRAPAPFA